MTEADYDQHRPMFIEDLSAIVRGTFKSEALDRVEAMRLLYRILYPCDPLSRAMEIKENPPQ